MVTLDPNAEYLILIDTFTVEPENADQLLAELAHATKTGMSRRQGFISANLHMSSDKRHIANYAQWRSQDDVDAMMRDSEAQAHMKKAAGLAIGFDPIYYSLRESFGTEAL